MGKEIGRNTSATDTGIIEGSTGECETSILVDDLKTADARQAWVLDKKHNLPDAKKAWEKFWNDDYDKYVDYLRKEKAP